MKKSRFAVTSFVVSMFVFIPAILIFATEATRISETNPFTLILFPIILITSLPEIPFHTLSLKLGFPIVLPTLSMVFAFMSLVKKEDKKNLAILGMGFVLISILMYSVVLVRFF